MSTHSNALGGNALGGNALHVEELVAHYGLTQALFGVGFAVSAQRTTALLGRNGAGKSTVLKCIIGEHRAKRGSIRFAGQEVARLPNYRVAKAGIAYVPEDRQVFVNHSVEENLLIGAKPGRGGGSAWSVARVYESFPKLRELRRSRAGVLSGGEQQMLTIARALMGNPTLLLLDEPSEGLAPKVIEEIEAIIHDLKRSAVTILIAEQNMMFCMAVADDAVIIDRGQVAFAGSMDELRARPDLKQRYLSI
jgi:branched-chain amino acid transport system ATP-binding protein